MSDSQEPSPFDKNTKEQYEELGHFVEAFEAMVNDVRNACIVILAGLDPSMQTFVSVAFHHQALTAKPLFEIMRTLIAEVSKDERARKKYKIDDTSANILSGVLGDISKEYMDLAKIRNNLLHGTWYVGFTGPEDLEAKEFYVSKLSTTKTGLKQLELPKTAIELRYLRSRCEKLRDWIAPIYILFFSDEGAERIKRRFWYDQDKEKWSTYLPRGDVDTLP
jgi:hypothetical protein